MRVTNACVLSMLLAFIFSICALNFGWDDFFFIFTGRKIITMYLGNILAMCIPRVLVKLIFDNALVSSSAMNTLVYGTRAGAIAITNNVRLVVHIDMPDSPEAYFQEAGRAGRDGLKAYAVLLYAKTDKGIMSNRLADTFPEKDYIRKVYEQINYYYQMAMGDGLGCTKAFNIDEFCRNFKHFPIQVDSALKILTRAGYLEYTDEQDNASRVIFTLRRDELYYINEKDPDTEKLIRVILRSYTGLFSDYAYIDEDTLAKRSGLTRQQVYSILITLTLHPRQKDTLYYIHARTPRQRPHSTKQRGVRRP